MREKKIKYFTLLLMFGALFFVYTGDTLAKENGSYVESYSCYPPNGKENSNSVKCTADKGNFYIGTPLISIGEEERGDKSTPATGTINENCMKTQFTSPDGDTEGPINYYCVEKNGNFKRLCSEDGMPGYNSNCPFYSESGAYQCVINDYSKNDVYGHYAVDDHKGKIYFYDWDRLDSWYTTDEYGDKVYTTNSGFKGDFVSVFPGMNLTYTRYIDIPDSVTEIVEKEKYTNLKLEKIKSFAANDKLSGESLPNNSTVEYWTGSPYLVKDIKLYNVDGIENNDDKQIAYRIEIKNLSSRGGTTSSIDSNIKLGYYGGAKPNCTGEPKDQEIVWHYFIPYTMVFTYEPSSKQKCTGAGSREYAYEHPNTCCDDYPETCCTHYSNADGISSIYDVWNKSSYYNLKRVCCYEESSTIKLDPPPVNPYVRTFYFDNSEESRKAINDLCKGGGGGGSDSGSCSWDPDSDNYCCNTREYKNLDRCNPSPDTCTNDIYFNNNKDECCNADPDDPRCTNPEYNPKCENDDYFNKHLATCCAGFSKEKFENNSSVCCNIVSASVESTDNYKKICREITPDDDTPKLPTGLSCQGDTWFAEKTQDGITERLTIKPTDKEMPAVSAGQGFEYGIKITDAITITSDYTYPTKGNYFSEKESDAKKLAEDAIRNYNINIESKINSLNKRKVLDQNIYFNVGNDDDITKYKYKFVNETELDTHFNGNIIKITKDSYKTSVKYSYHYSCGWMGWSTCNGEGYVEDYLYPQYPTATFTYDLQLPKYYISNSGLKDNDETENTIPSDKKNQYLDGGNKFYTDVYDKFKTSSSDYDNSLIYNKMFKISIRNGGASGNVSSVDSEYTCSYQISKCLTDGACIADDNNTRFPQSNKVYISGKEDYYSRPISLTTPFPNIGSGRTTGPNWNGTAKNGTYDLPYTYITSGTPTNPKGDKVYSKAMYSIKLTPELINNIKEYNNSQNDHGGYLDWEMTSYGDYKRTSKFLSCLKGTTSDCTENMRNAGLNTKKTLNITLSDEARKNKIGEF